MEAKLILEKWKAEIKFSHANNGTPMHVEFVGSFWLRQALYQTLIYNCVGVGR